MKILIMMDPAITIPVKGYGGHERLVEMFAKEYTRLGHKVDLLVTDGSFVEGCKVYGIGKAGFPPEKKVSRHAIFKAWKFLWATRSDYDLIHNFGRLIYLMPVLNNRVKKIMTYGRIVNGRNISLINKLPNRNLIFTAPSNWCVNTGNTAGIWRTVYNAIDYSKYDAELNLPDTAPFIFLSRLERLKGAHEAIEIAKRLNQKLIIAGNISPLEEEIEYFKKAIEPHIDGDRIVYVGTVNDEEKNKYLRMAKALLFPARTDEAFGMVMAEAMACGTPVLAYNHAAMPEVVTNGVTGFIVDNIEEMINAAGKINLISRRDVRTIAENNFDVKNIADQYLNLFDTTTFGKI
jgi:glycosyltransferase involved in cell wall biosynthesis